MILKIRPVSCERQRQFKEEYAKILKRTQIKLDLEKLRNKKKL